MLVPFLFLYIPFVFTPIQSSAGSPSEYQLKAAFLYNFALFTEWPEYVGDTLNLCVHGRDPFDEYLAKLDRRRVGTRRIVTHRTSTLAELPNCQVVFISRAVIGQLPRILDSVQGSPILTVADSPGAVQQGVALNMVTQHNRIAFEANLTAARSQGLNLSSRLLRLATVVEQ
ncbi:YfiR family protein [Ectothiorhodospira lacustris]|uniref:YfiR family protein n=1 Tax=Ectothiorhodospira lacustris TaxID=2899127 RepID=UPI001EE88F14|nr:YfiR family protein [Ectothiorhodospira lacustris]MCG5509528.1 YfiR family protein [Ectothiorhodospira lacustris]MCG5521677.1 YfiR family protein [Ectothiorhodospira lacustris]